MLTILDIITASTATSLSHSGWDSNHTFQLRHGTPNDNVLDKHI